jgi:hypothetical protein
VNLAGLGERAREGIKGAKRTAKSKAGRARWA